MRLSITMNAIKVAASSSNWDVLVCACRNNVNVNFTYMQRMLCRTYSNFAFPEQKAELLAFLRDDVHTQEEGEVDGVTDAMHIQKRSK